MKKTIVMLAACLIGMSHAAASDLLTIEDVLLRQGGVATIAIGCEFDTLFKGYQFDLELNGGLTLVLDDNDKPVWNNGFDGTDHTVSCTVVSDGKYRFVCVSTSNTPLPTSGVLLKLKVTGSGAMLVGDTFEGNVTAIEFTTLGTEVRDLPDASFSITIIDPRIILDENSTDVPEASEENAKVRVRRTINANEWSTICLPFAMTAEQIAAAFPGITVQLGDFNGYEVSDDGESINVKFTDVTSIEANHPYIIKVSEGVTEFTVDGVNIDPQEAIVDFDTSRRKNQPRQMVGTYVANTVIDWGTLFLNGNQFWYSVGSTKMKGYRAYFNFYDLLPDFENNYESRISMSFDNSTDIRDNKRETINDKCCYDLQGRKVSEFGIQNSELKKGVYIVNGKKYVNR